MIFDRNFNTLNILNDFSCTKLFLRPYSSSSFDYFLNCFHSNYYFYLSICKKHRFFSRNLSSCFKEQHRIRFFKKQNRSACFRLWISNMCPARRNFFYLFKQSSDLRHWKGYRNSSEDSVIYHHENKSLTTITTTITATLNGHRE